jgi:hypothetical protein
MRVRILLVVALLLSACSGADEGVRTIGTELGSSGSGSGSSSALSTSEGSEGSSSSSGAASTSEDGTASVAADGSEVACAPPSTPSDNAVAVTLTEWEVGVPAQVPSGTVSITAGNVGGDTHELVIVRADDPDDLPVSDGQVQEDQLPEGAFIGEIERFAPGDTCTGTFELPPGNYVFFCNLLEEEADGTIESHYEEGMRVSVTVG